MIKFTSLFIVAVSLFTKINAQNVGIGTTIPTNALHVVSTNDTAVYATTTANAPLIPAVCGYSNSSNSNQIGLLGLYNGTSGYGAGVAGIGFNGAMPPASKDIGVYASQHSSPGRALYVDGKMQLVDGSQSNGMVLTCDSTGTASWKKPAGGQHAFAATYSGSTGMLDIASGVSTVIPFDTEDYDFGGDFLNGVFTAPDSGMYHFDLSIIWSLSSSSTSYILQLVAQIDDPAYFFGRTGGISEYDIDAVTVAGNFTQNISSDIYLNAGNKLKIIAYQSSSGVQRIQGHVGFFSSPYSRFSAHKIF